MGADASELRRLSADLSRAQGNVKPRAKLVLKKSSFDISSTAKRIAPVDLGTLRDSIGVSSVSELATEIGPTVDYGEWVEVGTYKMAPQPYMGPATDKHAPAFEEAMAQLGLEGLLG